jgi:phosphoglycerate kinase
MRTIDDFDTENKSSLSRKLSSGKKVSGFKGKNVILRSDLNSEISKGKVVMSDRISESAKTIAELKRKGARVVVLAHQSRPGKKDFRGLEEHAKLLNKYTKIKFVAGIVSDKALREIGKLKNGEAVLLDNVRKLKEEFRPSVKGEMVKRLGKWGDIYVNDAFSVCHREQTSIVSFPKVMKSCVGRLVEKELKALKEVKGRDSLFILGGAKAEDNLMLMNRGRVLTCGIFGHLCLIAKGYDLGAQNKFLKKELGVIPKLKKCVLGVRTPLDLAVRVKGKRKDLRLDEFPSKYEVYDIGGRTEKHYVDLISRADAIFMKGPAGYCEEAQFCKGTVGLLRAIASSKGFKVLGGGHLDSALGKAKINKRKFDYISLSGGATVWYIAGKKLPGLEALKKGKR